MLDDFHVSKKNALYTYLILFVFFISICILAILISEKYIDVLDTYIDFLVVREWDEDGHSPSEKDISDDFLSFIFQRVNFLFVFSVNILPTEHFKNKKINYYLLASILFTIALILYSI